MKFNFIIFCLLSACVCSEHVFAKEILPSHEMDLAAVASLAMPGDTIVLGRGNYYSSKDIILKSNTILKGEGASHTKILINDASKAGIFGESVKNIQVLNLTIKFNIKSYQNVYGVYFHTVSGVTIDGVEVIGSPQRAIFIYKGDEVRVSKCKVFDVGYKHAPKSRTQGIVFSNVSKGIIKKCFIQNAGQCGVFLYQSKDIVVDQVEVYKSRGGIGLYDSKFVIVKHCSVKKVTSDHGMGVDYNTHHTYWYMNSVEDGGRFGFFIDRGSYDNVVIDSSFSRNLRGGMLITKDCYDNTVAHSTFKSNGFDPSKKSASGWGMYIKGSGNRVIMNKFLSNNAGNIFISPSAIANEIEYNDY